VATVDLTSENFNNIIDTNDIVIVDYWAPWCAPCRAFAPTFEHSANNNPGIVFAKVNTEDEQEIGQQFGIRSIPTLMIFKEQIIVFSQAGALTGADLQHVIDKALALDMDAVRAEMAEKS